MLGASAVASLGGLAYYLLIRPKGERQEAIGIDNRIDVAEVLEQYIIKSMQTYINTYQHRLQNTTISEEAVCKRNGWTVKNYYSEVMKRKTLGDSYYC